MVRQSLRNTLLPRCRKRRKDLSMDAKRPIPNRTEPWIVDGWNYATAVEPRLLPLADAARALGQQFPRRHVDPFLKSIKAKFIKLVGWDAAIDDARLTSDETYSAVYFHLLHLYETAQREARRHG